MDQRDLLALETLDQASAEARLSREGHRACADAVNWLRARIESLMLRVGELEAAEVRTDETKNVKN